MLVEIWSDVVCPWCYIGMRRLDAALAELERGDDVQVVWRSFELDPAAPRERTDDYLSHLARKYGVSPAEARGMIERVTRVGAEVGIQFRFDIARPGNSFDAHRLIHLAAEHGLAAAMEQRLFAATFTEGQPVGDPSTLAALASDVGLDAGEVQAVLQSDRYADDVRSDEEEATRLGITAVPFFAFDRNVGVAGAQRPEVLLQALRQ